MHTVKPNSSTRPPVRPAERFLVFGAPQIEDAEIEEVVATLRSGWLGKGPRVAAFEESFAAYKRAEHPLALNSCTAALHLSLLASGIGPGDEVITTAMTFCATVNSIIHTGATPVLCDVDPVTLNIDPDAIRDRITDKTRAILVVHFAGRACELDAIEALARDHDLRIIEDCAHAIETTYKGRPAGTIGDFGCFSFYATKNVATGEGGMLLSKYAHDAERAKTLSLHGMTRDAWKRFAAEGYRHYQVVEPGFKYNMMDIQAAIGIHQLARVDNNWERRLQVWRRYDQELADLPIDLPASPGGESRHGLHLYTIRLREDAGLSRDAFLQRMTAEGIGTGVHYLAIPEHPVYQERLGWRPEDYPNAMHFGRDTASLPLSARLTDSDVADVIEATRRALGAS